MRKARWFRQLHDWFNDVMHLIGKHGVASEEVTRFCGDVRGFGGDHFLAWVHLYRLTVLSPIPGAPFIAAFVLFVWMIDFVGPDDPAVDRWLKHNEKQNPHMVAICRAYRTVRKTPLVTR